jgi:hypothetical protein
VSVKVNGNKTTNVKTDTGMDKHSEIEFGLTIGRLERNIHDLTAEQALAYIAHKALTQPAGLYLFGLRMGLPEEYPNYKSSDTQLTAGLKRLVKWEMLHQPEQINVGGQGRPRGIYRRVATVAVTVMLEQLANSWQNAPWNQKDGTNV